MLSKALLAKLKVVGFRVTTEQDEFLAVVREALAELGGTEWLNGDLPSLFETLDAEFRTALCSAPDGPHWNKEAHTRWMRAARNKLLFGVPWRYGYRIANAEIPTVLALMANYEGTQEQKFGAALKDLRKAKEREKEMHAQAVVIRQANLADEKWTKDLWQSLLDLLRSEDAQLFMAFNEHLQELEKLCVRAAKES